MNEDVKEGIFLDNAVSNMQGGMENFYIPSQNEIEFKEKFFLRSEFSDVFEHLKAEIQNSNIEKEEKVRLAIILDCIPVSEMFEILTKFKLTFSKTIVLHSVYSYLGLSNSVKGKKQNLLIEKKLELKKNEEEKRNFFGKKVVE